MKKAVKIPIIIAGAVGGAIGLYELIYHYIYPEIVAHNPNHSTDDMNNAYNALLPGAPIPLVEALTPAANLTGSQAYDIDPTQPAPSVTQIKQTQTAIKQATGVSVSLNNLALNS